MSERLVYASEVRLGDLLDGRHEVVAIESVLATRSLVFTSAARVRPSFPIRPDHRVVVR
jgi:hypothetical protein